jgi:mannose-6-phosphate isomerase
MRYKERIEKNTLLEVMNFIPCKKGDTFFIEPGMVHAIGEGLDIAEIQQNSDVTYRVYDYDRIDANGNKRELHIDKSIAVSNLSKTVPNSNSQEITINFDGYDKTMLSSGEYFNVSKINIKSKAHFIADENSFISLLFLEGNSIIKYNNDYVTCNKGDTLFIPANRTNASILF